MGQPEFSQIVASAARESVVFSDLSTSVNLIAGAVETIDIFAPAGTIGELFYLLVSFVAPAGATTGNHFFTLTNTLGSGSYIKGTSTFGVNLTFNNMEWFSADTSKFPLSNPVLNIQALKFDANIGMRLIYTNSTNAGSTSRSYVLQYRKRVVG